MSERLLPLLDRLAGVPVLVLGDLMLDRYLWGAVSRISPEAPVPVLRVTSEDSRLGGAGSVIANLSALGAEVHAVAAFGCDAPGDALAKLLEELPGVDSSGIVRDPSLTSTQKTRAIARAQQLIRIDRDAAPPGPAVRARLREAIRAKLDHVAAVLVSDYARGVLDAELCEELSREARARGIPVLVDPHPNTPFSLFRGATALTPNRSETAQATGIEPRDPASIHAAAEALIERYELDWVTVTLDKDGIYLLQRGQAVGKHFPARARKVFDVAGAGDMVLSVLGLAIAAGCELEDALRMANVAAGWEVEQLGVVPLRRDALAAELRYRSAPELSEKVLDVEAAERRLRLAREEGKAIVWTNGCFDLLHAGHVHFLQGCRAKGDFLVVGLNTDDSIRGLKGEGRPVLPLQDRAIVLAGLEAVDLVVPFAAETPLAEIERLRPDILCKGEDYRGKVVVGRELVEGYGGRVELVELVPGVSTTNIIARIAATEGGSEAD
ncbi:MAG: bifunctional heptose 7-phosphate kinase/heptose 1-phosphate adenyltransferase [Planctomycetes bacterium]|nr:bifunctional heptose 7-phosphate kinase/heptose 1-phosphate adenyltransferase [Planctomycetota bacterium]